MSNDNVISIGSRKPLAVEQAEQAILAEEADKARAQKLDEHQELCLKTLDQIRKLVEEGRLQGLVIIGRDPVTSLFLTETVLSIDATPASEMFAYVGVVETLKLELADYASMAPQILNDGKVIDPWLEPGDDEEDEL